MRATIVGIHGLAGSGKDTFADVLVEHLGYAKVAFADELKRFVGRCFPAVSRDGLWGPSGARSELVNTTRLGLDAAEIQRWVLSLGGGSVACAALIEMIDGFRRDTLVPARVLLQKIGTEWGREVVGPDVWIRHLVDRAGPAALDPAAFGWKAEWGQPVAHTLHSGRLVVPDVRFAGEVDALHDRGAFVFKLRREGVGLVDRGVPGHSSEAGVPDDRFDVVVDVPEGLHRYRRLVEALHWKFVSPLEDLEDLESKEAS